MIEHFQGDVTYVSHDLSQFKPQLYLFSLCFLDEVPSVPRLEWHEIIVRRKIALKEKVILFIWVSFRF